MINSLQYITLTNFKLNSGRILDINLSYQIFGQELHTAPIILVNHALTGNSNVSGEKGWWKNLIGNGKIIDASRFTVICFNIPGNRFDGFSIENHEDYNTKDIAKMFLAGLSVLNIEYLYVIIGGSLGGSVGWEMLAVSPDLAGIFIPIACDYKTSDWIHAQCMIQNFLLNQQDKPLQKARIHAMLCYRTPESLNERFKNIFDSEKATRKSLDWLNFHAESLNERFSLSAYRLMNHLLMNINADGERIKDISADIHFIAVNSDLFFPASEMKNCFEGLIKTKKNTFYQEIQSIHGHDAFLMEYEQLNRILGPIINKK